MYVASSFANSWMPCHSMGSPTAPRTMREDADSAWIDTAPWIQFVRHKFVWRRRVLEQKGRITIFRGDAEPSLVSNVLGDRPWGAM